MKRINAGIACVVSLFIFGCEQNRYELSKDASGNTVRLDRRTGEMAIIKGDQIKTLRDAAQVDAEHKAAIATLEQFKSWNFIDSPTFDARVYLSTSWRDGKLYYTFTVQPLKFSKALDEWISKPKESRGEIPSIDPKLKDAILRQALQHEPITVELNDNSGFRLAAFNMARLTRLVDENGLAGALEDKGTFAMSEDDYRRISGWELKFR